jgi:hypothetical protein
MTGSLVNGLRRLRATEFCYEVIDFKYTIDSRDGLILCHLPGKAGWASIFFFWHSEQPLDFL